MVPIENILFASEMVGAVKGINPDTGEYYDDTRKYVDGADLTDEQRRRSSRATCNGSSPRLDDEPERAR